MPRAIAQRPVVPPAVKQGPVASLAPVSKATAAGPIKVDFSKPTPVTAEFTYPEFGVNESITFSPFGDVGLVAAAAGVLVVRPSTGEIMSTIPRLTNSIRTSPVEVGFNPTHLAVKQTVFDGGLLSFHHAATGALAPSGRFDFDADKVTPQTHVLSTDRTSVFAVDDFARDKRGHLPYGQIEGRLAGERATPPPAVIQLQADEIVASGFLGVTVSPTGNRFLVDSAYSKKPYVNVFDTQGASVARVPGSLVGFVQGDDFLVSLGQGADHVLAIHDGDTGKLVASLPTPGFDGGFYNAFRFRGATQSSSYNSNPPRGRIDLDASGRTLVVTGVGGAVHAWRFSIVGAADAPAPVMQDSSFEAATGVEAKAAKRTAAKGTAAKGTAAKGMAAKGTAAKGTAAKGTAAKGAVAKGTAEKATVEKATAEVLTAEVLTAENGTAPGGEADTAVSAPQASPANPQGESVHQVLVEAQRRLGARALELGIMPVIES